MKALTSFAQMAGALVEAVAAEHLALHAGLESVAVHVEKKAKAQIGHYQQEVGPFSTWEELADSTKADRLDQGYTENDPGLRSGEMRDSIEHKVSGLDAVIGSNDQDLVWFELGTDKQPPRSVLGSAVEKSHDHIKKVLGGAAIVGMLGHASIPASLEYEHDV